MSVGVVDSFHFLASKHKNVIPILGELTTIWVLESGGSTTFYNRKESLDTCFPASTERQPNVSTSWVQIIRCTNSGLYLGASDSRKSRFTPGAVTAMAAVLDLSEEKWKWWPMRWRASGFGILAERHVTSIYSEVNGRLGLRTFITGWKEFRAWLGLTPGHSVILGTDTHGSLERCYQGSLVQWSSVLPEDSRYLLEGGISWVIPKIILSGFSTHKSHRILQLLSLGNLKHFLQSQNPSSFFPFFLSPQQRIHSCLNEA